MFGDLAVIHPYAGFIVANSKTQCATRRHEHRVLPTEVRIRNAIDIEHLKEHSVQVKWMIATRRILHAPNLECPQRAVDGCVKGPNLLVNRKERPVGFFEVLFQDERTLWSRGRDRERRDVEGRPRSRIDLTDRFRWPW